MSRLVIKKHRPWWKITIIISLGFLVSSVAWFLLDKNHLKLINEQLNNKQTMKDLILENQSLANKNSDLQGEIFMLQQVAQLDKDAAIHIQKDLRSLQEEASQLKQELEFYQGVMDTAREETGLSVHGIYIEPLFKPNQYSIKLVLANVARTNRVLKGNLDINIEGVQNNNEKRMNLSDILITEGIDFSFEIKNFGRVEYIFELPLEFLADRVLVSVNLENAENLKINKIYDWPLI